MTKKSRTFLFIFLLIIFLLTAPAIILYSQGWRFDFETKHFTKTGAFYFQVTPKSAQIYLNDKLVKKTDFLLGSAYIDNLLPKKYNLVIAKPNYYSWMKSLEIKAQKPTEIKNIVLIPEKTNFNLISKSVESVYPSADGKKFIFKKISPQGWVLNEFDATRNVQSLLIEKSGDLLSFKISKDFTKLILQTSSNEKIEYFLFDTKKETNNLISLSFLGNDAENISFNPQDPTELLYISKNSLFRTNYNTKEIKGPILSKIVVYEFLNNTIYYLDSDGYLYKSDISFVSKDKLNNEPFTIENETEYKIIPAESTVFLEKGSSLYYLNNDKLFKKIFDSVNGVEISSNSEKISYFNDNEIWVFFLKDILDQPEKKAGDKLFITRFSEKISNVLWLTDNYLIFNTGDSIKVSEIDDRDKIQMWDIGNFKNPEIFYNQNDSSKKLYILSNGNFYSSDSLIP